MTRTPYTRQIRQECASAVSVTVVSALLSAGSSQLIADSALTDTPTVAAVLTIWLLAIVYACCYLRATAVQCSHLWRQQRLWRVRRMPLRERPAPTEELPDLDPATVARDARLADDWRADGVPETVEIPVAELGIYMAGARQIAAYAAGDATATGRHAARAA